MLMAMWKCTSRRICCAVTRPEEPCHTGFIDKIWIILRKEASAGADEATGDGLAKPSSICATRGLQVAIYIFSATTRGSGRKSGFEQVGYPIHTALQRGGK